MTIDLPANGLIYEKSPYLHQHAYNPVHWFPWGEEAFEKAKNENKPIFLSIGYSTCHWCHVMAHQSFEDEEVAEFLNENYISIKVDREERPDIDSVYMKVCQMLTGRGGWPLSVFLTPDQKPFYAGTYFPKESRHGRVGFKELITQLHDRYQENPAKVLEVADQITETLKGNAKEKSEQQLSKRVLDDAYKRLSNVFDAEYGGFGDTPKFPIPHQLSFLLKYHHLYNNVTSLNMVTKTLDSMANGGIYDHIGFGFARYSVDKIWLVPHFEKMLYDNALLMIVYLEAYQLTKNERYKEIVDQLYTFISREMTDDDTGGFYSALDADTEGEEGKFYLWTEEEIIETLGDGLGALYCKIYNITSSGNFEGKNIPTLIGTDLEKIASTMNVGVDWITNKLRVAREKLYEERMESTYPHVDDKILTSWNALMIVALSKASKALADEKYLEVAIKAITVIEEKLFVNGRLMVRYREDEVKHKGFIDDYACLLWAYLCLYEATFELNYLEKAMVLKEQMFKLFWDPDNGGFYFYGVDAEGLIVREKDVHDGAFPSGNGVAALALYKLGHLTGDSELVESVQEMFMAFKEEVEEYPTAHTMFLQGLIYAESPSKEIVILGQKNDPNRQRIVTELQRGYYPTVSVLVAEDASEFANIAPFAAQYKKINDETTVYVCENYTCQQPTIDINQVLQQLQ